MIRVLEKFYSNILPEKENFDGRKIDTLPLFLAVITIYLLLLIFGKFLWNEYLVKYVTIVKPIESIVDLLAIAILAALLFR
tara:strand:+ start:118 stop:360 length:243 start_codon:yes stop_codon:yes gene_type:complete